MASGLEGFKILLDSLDNTFSPGEMITGNVIVDLGRTKTIRGLKIRIKGKAEVRWQESRSSGKDRTRETERYTADEEYFRIEYYVTGGSGNSGNVDIQSGHHVFPFNFSLPQNIPSSFEHKNGSVRYTIKAIMDRPWKFDHQTSMSFTVEAPFDITQCPSGPIEDEDVHTFCCFPFFKMGSMSIHTHVPRSAYAVGDAVEAKVDINNKSNSVDVTGVSLLLEQRITLHSRFPRSKNKSYSSIVQKMEKSGPFNKEAGFALNIQVPAVSPSELRHCSIIDIEYFLNVEINVSGCHCKETSSYPISIGTRPGMNFQPIGNQFGIVQNPFAVGPVESSVPSAPFFSDVPPNGGALPFPTPMPRQQGALTYPPPMPNFTAAPPFQYPGAGNSAIGFIVPSSMQTSFPSGLSTEMPPPSYDACMEAGLDKK